jgi:energy-coupling factor transport system substrate-specific component
MGAIRREGADQRNDLEVTLADHGARAIRQAEADLNQAPHAGHDTRRVQALSCRQQTFEQIVCGMQSQGEMAHGFTLLDSAHNAHLYSGKSQLGSGAAMKWFTRDFTTLTFVLIPVAVVLNLVLGQLVSALRLPLFLDSIGSIFIGIVCGPWAALLTGVLTNVIGGLVVNPGFLPFTGVAAVIGFVAGWLARFGFYQTWWKALLAGAIITLFVIVVAVPTRAIVFGGTTPNPTGALTILLVNMGERLESAIALATLATNIGDKIASSFVAFLLAQGLSTRLLSRFPRPENVRKPTVSTASPAANA